MRRVSTIGSRIHTGFSKSNDISSIKEELENRGWDVSQKEDSEEPVLLVDIGEGLYEAKIEPDSTNWKFKFQFIGDDSLTSEGMTEDPIAEYMKWKKNPKLGEAWKEMKKNREEAEFNKSPATAPHTPRNRKQVTV